MKQRYMKQIITFVTAFALLITGSGLSAVLNGTAASAAKKTKVTLKLNKSKVSMKVGDKTTLKITKKNVKKIKSQTWTTDKKKVATVSKKGKVTAKKAGKATIKVKIKYIAKGSKKAVSKTLKCTVTVKAKGTATQAPATQTPGVEGPTPEPTPFVVPSAEPETIPFVLPEIDMSDPSAGVQDAATVTDAAVTGDTSNRGDSHTSKNGITSVSDNGMMRKQLTVKQLTQFMGQGWNLANTLESCGILEAESVTDYETGWGATETTFPIIKGVKAGGFNTVRIPVAWSNMVSDDGTYTIDTAYLSRVEQVVNWCLDNEMYVIINIHYDNDWWGQFGYNHQAVRDEACKRFESYWVQIANWFEEYSDRLIFESANEELGDRLNDDFINAKTGEGNFIGTLTEDQCYEMTNWLNQKFIEVVRKTGGNNTYRQLLLAGFNTDIDMTCDDRFVMPKDTVASNGTDKLSISVHYYTPSSYCISEDKTNLLWYREDWGTEEDYAEMRAQFEKMKKFSDAGYSVILGEYGPQLMSKKGVPEFIREVMVLGKEYNYAPVIWNTSMYNRTDKLFEYEDIAEVFKEITGVEMPLEEGPDRTGTIGVAIVEESQVTIKAAWEGRWSRTNNVGVQKGPDGKPLTDENGNYLPLEEELGGFSTTSCDEGLEIVSNAWWWQLFLKYDWNSMTQPCIRLTLADDEISQNAEFQLGYTTQADGGSYTFSNFSNAEYGSKVITLKVNKLAIKPWLAISSASPGATIKKIEIFDMPSQG